MIRYSKILFNKLLISTVILSLSACIKGDGELPESMQKGAQSADALVGKWVSDCKQNSSDEYTVYTYIFGETVAGSNGDYRGTFETFPDADCQKSAFRTIAFFGNYSLGETITTTDGVKAQQFSVRADFTIFIGNPWSDSFTNIYHIDSNDVMYIGDSTALNFLRPYHRKFE